MDLAGTVNRVPWASWVRRARLPAILALLAAGCCGSVALAQTPPEPIGKLIGDDVSVQGAVSFDVENGRSTATLASGSAVTVRAGQALIELNDGGEIAVCGPAHFSMLKSGGAITLALDYGTVHSRLVSSEPLTIFSPQVVATPVAIGEGPRDVTVGLDQQGALCTLAAQGALRIEQQFTGRTLLVPQGGTAELIGGQLSPPDSTGRACTCAWTPPPNTPTLQTELSVPIHPPAAPPAVPAPEPPAPSDQPIYQVYMPPLTFDSTSPEPPPAPDPQTILLVREARLEPAVVFRGRVEPAAPIPPPVPAAPIAARKKAEGPKRPGVFTRLFDFLFRRHRNHPVCGGVGCESGN